MNMYMYLVVDIIIIIIIIITVINTVIDIFCIIRALAAKFNTWLKKSTVINSYLS